MGVRSYSEVLSAKCRTNFEGSRDVIWTMVFSPIIISYRVGRSKLFFEFYYPPVPFYPSFSELLPCT